MADENVVQQPAQQVEANTTGIQEPQVTPTKELNEADQVLDESVLDLVGAFAKSKQEAADEADLRRELEKLPEYQEYMMWKQQRGAQQAQAQPVNEVDYSKVIKDPNEFKNYMNNFQTNIQAMLMQTTNQILEMAEIMYHLKSLEEKYPEISESPRALQLAILKAKSLGLSPREIAEKAVTDYITAYRIRQNILKNKNVVNVSNEQLPIQGKSSVRETTESEEHNPFDFILKAFRSE